MQRCVPSFSLMQKHWIPMARCRAPSETFIGEQPRITAVSWEVVLFCYFFFTIISCDSCPFFWLFGIFVTSKIIGYWESQWKKNLVTSAAVKTTSLLNARFWENHWDVGRKSHLLNLCQKLHLTSNPWCGFQSRLGFLPKRDEDLRKTGSKN